MKHNPYGFCRLCDGACSRREAIDSEGPNLPFISLSSRALQLDHQIQKQQTKNRTTKMAIIATDNGSGDYELIPEDNHAARCVMIAEIGTQETPFGAKRQVIIGWELPGERRTFDAEEGEKPAMLSKFYTLSLNQKANLRLDLESWRGRAFTEEELGGFDIESLAGVPCLLNVVHKADSQGSTRAKISTISRLPKGMSCPDQENATRLYEIGDGAGGCFDVLPEWIQNQIKNSIEWNAGSPNSAQIDTSKPAPVLAGDISEDDDIPF